jgi:hypothetical protein
MGQPQALVVEASEGASPPRAAGKELAADTEARQVLEVAATRSTQLVQVVAVHYTEEPLPTVALAAREPAEEHMSPLETEEELVEHKQVVMAFTAAAASALEPEEEAA